MRSFIFQTFFCIVFLGFISCAKESDYLNDITVTGDISGVVKDEVDGHLLSNCNVSLSPDNKSCVTNSDGSFTFQSLKSGSYNLTYKKNGYQDETRTIKVEAGRTSVADILMKPKPAFVLSEKALNFEDTNSTLSFQVTNESDNPTSFEINNIPEWAFFSPQQGTVQSSGSLSVSVTVDRKKVDYGKYSQNVTFSYSSRTSGSVTISLSMEKVRLSKPNVLISSSASNITSTSFTIGGKIVSIGGATITSYGHCWSLSNTPTINDNKTNLGSTNATGDFSSSITGLSASKTYYVRAYATNSEGTSYSDVVMVTTASSATVPQVSISTSAGNITSSSFTIGGKIIANGGAAITSYGHCWSLSGTPTVNSNKTNLGSTNATGDFSSSITGLSASKTYYVRAYATNSEGTSYSDVVMVTTASSATVPQVSISTSAGNITSSSFTIGGKIIANGGTTITSYGHCWSLSGTPTVNGNKTNLGSTNATGDFSSSITGLSASKTYYVRAYATNSEGTSYSSTITVTTSNETTPGGNSGNDTGGDSGSGNGGNSSGFAGGSGTFGNPYKVSNVDQLLLIRNNSDKCFELINDINLGGTYWSPFAFGGTLDGCGYKIKSLSVSKTSGNLGLFSSLGKDANIQNLIIDGVKIESSGDCVGALAGLIEYGGSINIKNVRVNLSSDSYIIGNDNVGGLIGSVAAYSDYGFSISGCQVSYSGSGYAIRGNNNIGGLIGKLSCLTSSNVIEVKDCSASVSVKGGKYIGGIVGSSKRGMIVKSVFTGSISAQEYAGGIAGSINSIASYFSVSAKGITACKAQVDIQCSRYVGGITGWAQEADIVSCYSSGTISASDSSGGLCGYYYSGGESYLSYSTINRSLGNNNNDCATIASTASGSNTEANCTNITNHLKSAGSQFANYWNFNKTWTWTGTINGSSCNVSCPKLAWE